MRVLNSKKGLTLLEVVLAVLIMAFGITPIMRFAPTILQTKLNVEVTTESTFLATERIENARGRILNDFDKEGGYGESETLFPAPLDNYKYSITDDLDPDIKTISVSAWHEDKPGNKVTLYTKVARREEWRPNPDYLVANITLRKDYNTIQEAANEARTNDSVKAKAVTFIENAIINTGIKLSGGWSADWTSRDSYSTVDGNMTFNSGESVIEWFIIE